MFTIEIKKEIHLHRQLQPRLSLVIWPHNFVQLNANWNVSQCAWWSSFVNNIHYTLPPPLRLKNKILYNLVWHMLLIYSLSKWINKKNQLSWVFKVELLTYYSIHTYQCTHYKCGWKVWIFHFKILSNYPSFLSDVLCFEFFITKYLK